MQMKIYQCVTDTQLQQEKFKKTQGNGSNQWQIWQTTELNCTSAASTVSYGKLDKNVNEGPDTSLSWNHKAGKPPHSQSNLTASKVT